MSARAALLAVAATVAGLLAGCGPDVTREPLARRGALLARDPAASTSRTNTDGHRYTCLTCHAERASQAGDRALPGAPFEGVTRRPSYWNGETIFLREAVGRCWTLFLDGSMDDLDDAPGEAIFAYLHALSPEGASAGTAAVRATYPAAVAAPMGGDPNMGAGVYVRACQWCHGAAPSGDGRVGPLVPPLPRGMFGRRLARDAMAAKVRHGGLVEHPGWMPPFSTEVLTDTDLAHLLAYLDAME